MQAKRPAPGSPSANRNPASRSDWLLLLGGALLAAGAIAAYSRTFSVPLLFDDIGAIGENRTIRHWSTAFWPSGNITASGRPILNLSLAFNYAISGTAVWSYHVVNLAIHILAGMTLFGIVRRTLRLRSGQALRLRSGQALRLRSGQALRLRSGQALEGSGDGDAVLIGFSAALLWTLHPLQTEAVTYIVQRAESLMGLFYLLTLYCFIRAVGADVSGPLAGRAPNECYPRSWRNQGHLQSFGDSGGLPNAARSTHAAPPATGRCASWVWYSLSVGFCLLGVGTKEVMVSAPLMVLLYDRTFVAGSFRKAWGRRRGLYLGLGATWLPLACLVAGTGWNRNGSEGAVGGAPWQYWLTQFEAVTRYLWLSVWPHPLVFEYGTFWTKFSAAVAPHALLVAGLAAAALVALWRRPALGFLGAWFFAILAPTSIVPGRVQMIVEHRMYLPLAAVVVAGVVGLHTVMQIVRDYGLRDYGSRDRGPRDDGQQDYGPRDHGPRDHGQRTTDNGTDDRRQRTSRRPDHRTADWLPCGLWSCGPVVRSPVVPMVLFLALALGLGALTAARNEVYRSELGIWNETIARRPASMLAHFNLGSALSKMPGRLADAAVEYREALRLDPDYAEAHNNLGFALAQMPGRLPDAVAQFEAALRLNPKSPGAHINLGNALSEMPGRLDEAVAHYEAALRLEPDVAEVHSNLGFALAQMPGRLADAVVQYEAALRLSPDSAETCDDLGLVLSKMPGRLADAAAQFENAVRLKPDYAEAHNNLGIVWMRTPGRLRDAIAEFEAAVRANPEFSKGWHNLGLSWVRFGNLTAASEAFQEEVRLSPNDPEARQALAMVLQQAGDH